MQASPARPVAVLPAAKPAVAAALWSQNLGTIPKAAPKRLRQQVASLRATATSCAGEACISVISVKFSCA